MAGSVVCLFRAAAVALVLAAWAGDPAAPEVFAGRVSDGMAARPLADREGRWEELRRAAGLAPPQQRMARVDFGRLAAAHKAAASGRPSRLKLNLFEGAEFDWIVERTARTASGYALSGPLAGVEMGTATLVANGGMVVGSAWTPQAEYRIRTAGRSQIVERIDSAYGPACDGAFRRGAAVPSHARAQAASAGAAADDGSEIDVLVAYTRQARRWAGGHRAVLADIDHDVAWTNEALAVSGAGFRVRLVAAVALDYDETREVAQVDQDAGREVSRLRDHHAADVVIYKRTRGGNASWLSSLADPEHSAEVAYVALVPVGRQATFAHELGHVMGLLHHRGDQNGNEPFPYSHGYVLPGFEGGLWMGGVQCGPYSTIMACMQLPRFSNPRQHFQGVPLGVPGDEPSWRVDGPADAVRSLNETRRFVAGYRQSAGGCRYRLSAAAEVAAAGGTYTLHVEAAPGCAWEARSADGFTTVASGTSGVGDGTVAYRVPPNDGWEREVALAVAGRMHVVVQPGTRAVKPICDRGTAVREALEAELGRACGDIAATDLAGIAELTLQGQVTPGDLDGLADLGVLFLRLPPRWALRPGTFDGLAGLQRLWIQGGRFRGGGVNWPVLLEPGTFRGLENLHNLTVLTGPDDEALPPLQPGVFEGMPRLRTMALTDGRVAVEPGLFDGLSGLNELYLISVPLTRLPAGVFRGLANLRLLVVYTHYNPSPLTVEAGTFEGLPNLERLGLNSLAGVPQRVFAGLSKLHSLSLRASAFTSLEAGAFDGLSSLKRLDLQNAPSESWMPFRHELATLPPGLFAGLPIWELHMGNVGLRELRPETFRDVDIGRLSLENNQLTALVPDMFDDMDLYSLDLSRNLLASLPAHPFEDQPRLYSLDLSHNRLTALPPGLFVGASARLHSICGDRRGYDCMTVALHGNPGAPFKLALEPVVASAAWQRPVRVAVHVAEGAPFELDVGLQAEGARLEAGAATIAPATDLSGAVAVSPTGAGPVVVRVTAVPDVPGADCADILDAGQQCGLHFTGIRLVAGTPLLLNGIADRPKFDAPAAIDLSNVFLEFDGSDAVTFAVRSSDPRVASTELAGAALRVAPAEPGTATVAVTATAADGRTVTRSFAVTVPVPRPRLIAPIEDVALRPGDELTVRLDAVFEREDGLRYAVESSVRNLAPATLRDSRLRVIVGDDAEGGMATVTVRAINAAGVSTSDSFDVGVAAGEGAATALDSADISARTRVELASLLSPFSAAPTYNATASPRDLANIEVADGDLTIVPREAESGRLTLVITANNGSGVTVVRRIQFAVTGSAGQRLLRGWRLALPVVNE